VSRVGSAGSPGDSASVVARIDEIAQAALSGGPIAGLSVAVRFKGSTLVEKGYGFANAELRAPAGAQTVYHVDSITKHVTSAGVLKLAEEGKLSLDDELSRWVPKFSTGGRRVTVRQLLSHTSGIKSYTSIPRFDSLERLDLSHDEILALVAPEPFDFEPGTSWRYDNSGFYLAGLVIEQASGMSYADFLRERIFKPLGMAASGYGDSAPLIPGRSSGYVLEKGALANATPISWKPVFAGGAICSTVGDLVKFEEALEAGRLVSKESVAAMRRPTRLPGGVEIDYGFGTRRGSLDGHAMFGHTGGGGGFNSVLLRFPADDLTIAVLTNTESRVAARKIGVRIARAVLNLTEREPAAVPIPKGDLAGYAGRFDSDEGPVENVVAGDGLRTLLPGAPPDGVPLSYAGDGVLAPLPGILAKTVRANGRVEWLLVYYDGLFMDAKRRVLTPEKK
jgi:CubicO group peptidase (beta-lactamase class C family)